MKKSQIAIIMCFTLSIITINSLDSITTVPTVTNEITILQPSLTNPIIINPGDQFETIIKSTDSLPSPSLTLISDFINYSLEITQTRDDPPEKMYEIITPDSMIPQLYSIMIQYPSEVFVSPNSVMVEPQNGFEETTNFIHITDIHIDGSEERTNQLRQLIEEINTIRPNFVLLTGDLVEGLTFINNERISGVEQYPIVYNLIKGLKVPVLIISGNHDIAVNNIMNGVELWEDYFLPIDYVVNFDYKNYSFVGVSTYDTFGITTSQLNQIKSIFKDASNKLKFFFAHSDYDNNQFPSIYTQNNVYASFLGHEHAGYKNIVGSTIEFVTDNSLTLLQNEPGHYRFCQLNNSELINYSQIESFNLKSQINKTKINDDLFEVTGYFKNDNPGITFPVLHNDIVLTGHWKVNNTINVSLYDTFYNDTHTKLSIKIKNLGNTQINYTLDMIRTSQTTEETTSTEPPKTETASNTIPESSSSTPNTSWITLLGYLTLVSLGKKTRTRR